MKTTVLKIEGMSCAGCAASARQALERVPGVSVVQVDLALGQATVERTSDVQERALIAAVTDAGFDATVG